MSQMTATDFLAFHHEIGLHVYPESFNLVIISFSKYNGKTPHNNGSGSTLKPVYKEKTNASYMCDRIKFTHDDRL